jgi:hypothetical protein
MQIIVTVHESVFGTIKKEFTNQVDALNWIQALIENDANFTVETTH